jgi:hypothetical protein
MAGNAIRMLETARGMLQNAPATRWAISTDSAAINKEFKKKTRAQSTSPDFTMKRVILLWQYLLLK